MVRMKQVASVMIFKKIQFNKENKFQLSINISNKFVKNGRISLASGFRINFFFLLNIATEVS